MQDRAHFFAMCVKLMRRILVDWARARFSLKRGGDRRFLDLNEALIVSPHAGADLVALDDVLKALEAIDSRFFGGLSVHETAEALHVSEETVHRDWKLAKGWLRRELGQGASGGA